MNYMDYESIVKEENRSNLSFENPSNYIEEFSTIKDELASSKDEGHWVEMENTYECIYINSNVKDEYERAIKKPKIGAQMIDTVDELFLEQKAENLSETHPLPGETNQKIFGSCYEQDSILEASFIKQEPEQQAIVDCTFQLLKEIYLKDHQIEGDELEVEHDQGPEVSKSQHFMKYSSHQQIQLTNKCCQTDYSDNNYKKYLCVTCNKTFKKNSNLVTHVKTVHRKEKIYQCNLCRKIFGHNSSLRRHVNNVHNLEKKYKCIICSKLFGQSIHLVTHVENVHKMVKKYCCDICNKAFGQKVNVIRHMESIHKMEKNYQCNICGKAFGNKFYISLHMNMVHKKERNYHCYICSKAFGTKSQLVRHMNVVHKKEKKYKCDICSKAFGRKLQLVNHIERKKSSAIHLEQKKSIKHI